MWNRWGLHFGDDDGDIGSYVRVGHTLSSRVVAEFSVLGDFLALLEMSCVPKKARGCAKFSCDRRLESTDGERHWLFSTTHRSGEGLVVDKIIRS
jgi:hypothetical protein